jgi:hypothetical protein
MPTPACSWPTPISALAQPSRAEFLGHILNVLRGRPTSAGWDWSEHTGRSHLAATDSFTLTTIPSSLSLPVSQPSGATKASERRHRHRELHMPVVQRAHPCHLSSDVHVPIVQGHRDLSAVARGGLAHVVVAVRRLAESTEAGQRTLRRASSSRSRCHLFRRPRSRRRAGPRGALPPSRGAARWVSSLARGPPAWEARCRKRLETESSARRSCSGWTKRRWTRFERPGARALLPRRPGAQVTRSTLPQGSVQGGVPGEASRTQQDTRPPQSSARSRA